MHRRVINKDLIISFFTGEIDPKEESILKEWVNASEENKKYFFEIKTVWSMAAQANKASSQETEYALAKLNEKILSKENVSVERKYIIGKILKIAVVFLLTISLSSLSTFIIIKKAGSAAEEEVTVYFYAPLGSQAKTLLPDGSQVWLNAGSQISYRMDFNKKSRIVNLEGEGFFEVKTNPEKPFVVKAKGLDIKAYGTAFNVKAYKEEKAVITTLVRGKVFIEGKDNQNNGFTIQMKPKQSVVYLVNKQSEQFIEANQERDDNLEKDLNVKYKKTTNPNLPILTSEDVKTELYTSWKDARWVINGEQIGELAAALERRYNVKIIFLSEELKTYRFTGIFQNETLEQVFQVLKLTAPMKYEIGQGIVTVSIDESLRVKFNKYFKNH